MNEIKESIAVQELREAGEDGGELMGYWCRGHVPQWEFSEAANTYSGAAEGYDVRHVSPRDVRHVWWRTVPVSGATGMVAFHDATPGSPGAFQASVADVVARRNLRLVERQIGEQRRQYANGFSGGANWACQLLDRTHPEAAKLLTEAWRNGGADRAQKDGE